tara:strand:+ start:595 stop:726 length:132 start_codon:yes stop_codon:yes gene_type:complete
MYGDILLIKEKKEKEYIVKINKVDLKILIIILKNIEGREDEKK